MNHGKKPTVAQRKLLKSWRLNWLICSDNPNELVIQHRLSSQVKRLPKIRGNF